MKSIFNELSIGLEISRREFEEWTDELMIDLMYCHPVNTAVANMFRFCLIGWDLFVLKDKDKIPDLRKDVCSYLDLLPYQRRLQFMPPISIVLGSLSFELSLNQFQHDAIDRYVPLTRNDYLNQVPKQDLWSQSLLDPLDHLLV